MANSEKAPELELADVIRDLAHGATNRQGSAKLAELIKACQATGKKGVLTLKLGIAVDPATKIAQLVAQFTTSRPEPTLPGGMYYTTSEGALVTDDPRQLNLDVTQLPTPRVVSINGSNNGGK